MLACLGGRQVKETADLVENAAFDGKGFALVPSPGVLGDADATCLVKSVPGEARSEKLINRSARQLHCARHQRVDVALSVSLELDEVARQQVKEEELLVGGKSLNKSKSKFSNRRRNRKSGKDVGVRQTETSEERTDGEGRKGSSGGKEAGGGRKELGQKQGGERGTGRRQKRIQGGIL
jgi:hypothetical protein